MLSLSGDSLAALLSAIPASLYFSFFMYIIPSSFQASACFLFNLILLLTASSAFL